MLTNIVSGGDGGNFWAAAIDIPAVPTTIVVGYRNLS